jgi:hypothetical protein
LWQALARVISAWTRLEVVAAGQATDLADLADAVLHGRFPSFFTDPLSVLLPV